MITAASKSDENAVATCNVSVKKPAKEVTAQKKVVRVDVGYPKDTSSRILIKIA